MVAERPVLVTGLHQGQPVRVAGEPLDRATAALLLLHGRGATAGGVLSLAADLAQPGLALLAPQAQGSSWYPYRFLAPLADNEPHLSSALGAVSDVLDRLAAAGIPPKKTLLLGFSQGACLALEFAARNAHRYGGLVGLSGGLIGPEGTPRHYAGSLAGTPVFLGYSDSDPHIPKARVEHTADVLRQLGGDVTAQLYAGLGHTINHDEWAHVQRLVARLLGNEPQRDGRGE
jgi:phospholipase/carboxylesterase